MSVRICGFGTSGPSGGDRVTHVMLIPAQPPPTPGCAISPTVGVRDVTQGVLLHTQLVLYIEPTSTVVLQGFTQGVLLGLGYRV